MIRTVHGRGFQFVAPVGREALLYRLAGQLELLVSEVLAVWRDTSVTPVERRRRIFVMWDECEEPGPASESAVQRIRGDAAALARARIEALVRLLAPAGSPRAYTRDELARLNTTRRSARAFDPYGSSGGAGVDTVDALDNVEPLIDMVGTGDAVDGDGDAPQRDEGGEHGEGADQPR